MELETLLNSSTLTYQVSNPYAFALLQADGSVLTWGQLKYGGNSSAVASHLVGDVIEIVPSKSSFAALKSDGSVVAWGLDSEMSSSASSQLQSGVTRVISNEHAFLALKSNGR